MITEANIKQRIAEKLKDNGFDVYASEVKEGFSKPAVFVSVLPSNVKLLTCGGASEEVTDNVEIRYYPSAETEEECISAATRIKNIFFRKQFDIFDRKLTIEEMDFDIEKNVLSVFFDITFIQHIDEYEETEPMESLRMEGF